MTSDAQPNGAVESEAKAAGITAEEYLRQQEELEEEAKEILPYNFDKCTYGKGYLKQSVYACKTCTPPDSKEMAGVCYSCSISCHGHHDLVELFTKRNFRCDCGTSRITYTNCGLQDASKDTKNEHNVYGQNFRGRFCWCHVDYDPAKEESEMYQCVSCQDWFHDKCIGKMPNPDNWDAFLCRDCLDAFPYLKKYAGHPRFLINDSVIDAEKAADENPPAGDNESIKIESTTDASDLGKRKRDAEDEAGSSQEVKKAKLEEGPSLEGPSPEKPFLEEPLREEPSLEGPPLAIKTDTDTCIYDTLPEVDASKSMDLFMKEGYESAFCGCSNCKAIINEKHAFLYEDEDVFSPEEDPDLPLDSFQAGLQALERMDRVKAIEGLRAYDKMKEEVVAFLRPFADQGKEVSEAEVRAFFQERGIVAAKQ